MSLVLLEGLDRTGKSTVAAYYESLGYEKIHLTAPPKELFQPGYTGPSYLDMMVDLLQEASTKDVVMDRSHYGELVWPEIFGRKSLLSEEDIEVLRELEDAVGVTRIMMHDTNLEAHWKRCVDNKEPINKQQFSRARGLYSQIAMKYGFELMTLPNFIKKFPDAQDFVVQQAPAPSIESTSKDVSEAVTVTVPSTTKEQQKLMEANAINDIMSKRILKGKGQAFDQLENDIRNFLNSKLAKLLGGSDNEPKLTKQEVEFFKLMYKKALQKGER